VFVNQGVRPASIIAVLGDEALLEYEMPRGSTAMWVIPKNRHDAPCPKKWLKAIEDTGLPWTGRGQ
jgi:hypothetical protein